MKISHWAIIFIIIVFPFSLICRNLVNNKFATVKDEVRLNNVVDTATNDAVNVIIEISEITETGKNIPLTKEVIEEAIDRFFATMSVNFNMPYSESSKNNARDYFSTYIPAIIIVGYDGFYVYSLEETANGLESVLSPKILYAYESDNGEIINFTLDNEITLYVDSSKLSTKVFKGKLTSKSELEAEYAQLETLYGTATVENIDELSQITNNLSVILYALEKDGINISDFLLSDSEDALKDYEYDEKGNIIGDAGAFHKKRREVIISKITTALQKEVNEHNSFANNLGVQYTFYIPDVSRTEWNNSIDDISVLAFIQGIPIGYESYYNSYALGGSRIVESKNIMAVESDKLYHRYGFSCYGADVGPLTEDNDKVTNIFLNRIDAAKAGYNPCLLCRP